VVNRVFMTEHKKLELGYSPGTPLE
jgi:hypothetical protein